MKKSILTTLVFSSLFLVLLSQLSSCKKDTPHEPATTYTIEGLWIGTIANATSGPQYYSLSIKPGGKLTFEGLALNQQHFGTGTWSLNDSTFVGYVETVYGISTNVGVTQTFTATFNASNGTLTSGTWQNTNPKNDNGTFSLTEVR